MPRKSVLNWGEWIIARSRVVGFRRQRDLAKAIGCSEDQLSRWAQRAQPPEQMRKGFDSSLARSLLTTREMLFEGWRTTAPEQAQREVLHPDQFFGQLTQQVLPSQPQEALLHTVVTLLFPREIEWVLQEIAQMVVAKGDGRAPEFRRLMDQFKFINDTIERMNRAMEPAKPASLTAKERRVSK